MAIEDSDHQMKLQIEQAAVGCVSGTLAEWPHLLSALRHYGYRCDRSMDALKAKELARKCCAENGWLLFVEDL